MASPCGTYGGYNAHFWRKEKPCRICKDAANIYKRDLLKRNPAYKERSRVACRIWYHAHPAWRHGVTLKDLLEKQENKCAICKKSDSGHWCVDHDHKHCLGSRGCKVCVRGALCAQCNAMLGRFEMHQDRILIYLQNAK